MSALTVNMQSFAASDLFLPSSAYAYPAGDSTASKSTAFATSGSYDQWSRWLRSSMRSRRSLLLDHLDYHTEWKMKKPTMLNGQPQQQKPMETAPQQHQYQHQHSFCFRQQETVEDAEQDAFCTCSSELSRGISILDDSSNSTTATTSLKRKCRQHEGGDDSLLHEQYEILKQIQRENQGRQQHEAKEHTLPTPMAAAAAASMSCSSSSAVSGVTVSLSSSVSSSSMDRKVKAKPTTQTKRPVVEVLAADVAQRGEKTALFQCPACRQMLTIDRSIPVVYCPTCQSCSRTDW